MRKAIVLLAAGAAVGALGMLVLGTEHASRGSGLASSAAPAARGSSTAPAAAGPAAQQDLPASSAAAAASSSAAAGFAASRLALYERVTALTSTAEIEARLYDAAGAPDSPARNLELEALLARFAELDPAGATQIARSLFLDDELVAAAFVAAAGVDADAALVELESVGDLALRRDVALALLEALGDGAAALERVSSALPEPLRPAFEVRALVLRAERDPAAALRAAAGIEDMRLRRQAFLDIARAAKITSPGEVAGLVALVEDASLAGTIATLALREWAQNNPVAALEYLETGGASDAVTVAAVAQAAAAANPQRLLAMLDKLPSESRTNVRQAAARAIAARDPRQAMSFLETLPVGQERDNLVQTIAQNLARQDPDAAIAWVGSINPPPRDGMRAVIQGIAAVDFNRAVDMVLREVRGVGNGVPGASGPGGGFSPLVGSVSSLSLIIPIVASQRAAANAEGMLRLLDGLIESGAEGRSLMSSTVSLWVQTDAPRATSWVLTNVDRLPAGLLENVAERLAVSDAERAAAVADQVPPARRSEWVAGVAGGLAQQDAASATQWLERFRGQPGYDAGLGAAARRLSQFDPSAAARLLMQASPAVQAQSASQVVMQWSEIDPPAAARWIESLGNEQARLAAAGMAASAWAQRDAAAAERWARGLSTEAERDLALVGVFAAAAAAGPVPTRILDALSSDEMRQRAIMNSIQTIAVTDANAARQLLTTYVTDPRMRQQAEQIIERGSGTSLPLLLR